MLPSDAKDRKNVPIATGFVDYFPDAVAAVAELSRKGNEQHNPGTPLHWDRSKSGDEDDAAMRHFVERGTFDTDGVRHRTKFAWRAMAGLQKEIEADAAKVDDGWIDWAGGDECPVPADTKVEVRFRHGGKSYIGLTSAGSWFWCHNQGRYDIVAYKVLK